jgi:hypothetical protein
MYAVHAMGLLRVSEEGELDGLDLHEHGISAYPEYVIYGARFSVRVPLAHSCRLIHRRGMEGADLFHSAARRIP